MTQPSEGRTGRHQPERAPRLGDSRAPFTTAAVLAAAAIAVIAGLVVLRSVTDQRDDTDEVVSVAATVVTTTPAATILMSSTTSTSSTTTTVVPRPSKSAATVVVANASGLDGSATAMAAELAADGYTTAPVANATGPRLERSIIYYLEADPIARGVAGLLAEQIPTAQTLPMPDSPPLDRPLAAATVALLLGRDAAGRPLAELQAG